MSKRELAADILSDHGIDLDDLLAGAVKRLYAADRAVHSAYDGECEHGFGPPATLCPNAGCPDRELAEAWAALL